MAYPVKNFFSTSRGAPVWNGTPNSTINLLQKCLIEGFGEVTALTGVIQDGVCTLSFNSGESFETDKVILISGANVTSINGEQWVTATSSVSCSFKTLESNQTLIGTIKVRYAPVGNWYIPFSGTSLAAFRSNHAKASDLYFYIDDTAALIASMNIRQEMQDITNGIKPTDYVYYTKSNAANTTGKYWTLVADGLTVYFSASYGSNYAQVVYSFGHFIPWGYETRTNAFIIGQAINQNLYTNSGLQTYDVFLQNSETVSNKLFRNPATGEYNVNFAKGPKLNTWMNNTTSGAGYTYPGSYNLPNRKILVSEQIIISSGNLLGTLPGIRYIHNVQPRNRLSDRLILDGFDSLAGRRIMKWLSIYGNERYLGDTDIFGIGLIDITGPWE